jgi:hypothetical protein
MMLSSRPLRASLGFVGGWILLRTVVLWPPEAPAMPQAAATPCHCGHQVRVDLADSVFVDVNPLLDRGDPESPPPLPQAERAAAAIGPDIVIALDVPFDQPLVLPVVMSAPVTTVPDKRQLPADANRPPHQASRQTDAPHVSVSAWAIGRRDGASAALSQGGILGGSQIGARLRLRPWSSGPLSPLGLTARLSAPLANPVGKEGSVGLVWRVSRNIPIDLYLERRIALDRGGLNAFSIQAAGGVSDVRMPLGLRLDAYGQAGWVATNGGLGFADGAVRVERLVWSTGATRLALGAGLWGAVQPGVARLDVGPQAVLHFASGNAHMRLSAEWRQRIAGNARPASGPAISLGTDF